MCVITDAFPVLTELKNEFLMLKEIQKKVNEEQKLIGLDETSYPDLDKFGGVNI